MSAQQMEIEGVVTAIIFRNEANGYTVLELQTPKGQVTAVGNTLPLAEGESVHITGEWSFHREYGRQIKMHTCRPSIPQSDEQMKLFLQSGLVKGCGPNFAQAIVDRFQERTHEVLTGDPAVLTQVPKIGMATAIKICHSYTEKMHMRAAVGALMEWGMTANQAIRIVERLGDGAVSAVQNNPYQLIEIIPGIGFRIADAIAQQVGVAEDSPFRVMAAAKHCLAMAGENGHTYLPGEELVKTTANLLSMEERPVAQQIAQMCATRELVLAPGEEEPVYLPMFYEAEQETARRLLALAGTCERPAAMLTLDALERSAHLKLSQEQRDAVECAMQHRFTVITGGPGTGKTTIVRFLLEILSSAGVRCLLCAPTGRAAKRMAEATGYEAKTIHRLLEYSGEEGALRFARNEENPLECDLLIVDETSMVDIFLMCRVLRALPPHARLILIGDADQLPSVGPGNVLRDIIQSGRFCVRSLTTIYRQGEGSGISIAAHQVNAGEMPIPAQGEDFKFVACDGVEMARRIVVNTVKKVPDCQVIVPAKKGELGVVALNRALQEALNPPHREKPEIVIGETVYREGDRVMQTKNDYMREWHRDDGLREERGQGIFNGEMGTIVSLRPQMQTAVIVFDDERRAVYPTYELAELDLCYAISVHKSQGSEFDTVLLPLYGKNPLLYTRNLLYTAITRAKRRAAIVGTESAVEMMVQNNRMQLKYSGLLTALRDGEIHKD